VRLLIILEQYFTCEKKMNNKDEFIKKKENTLENFTQHFNSIQNVAFKKELDRS